MEASTDDGGPSRYHKACIPGNTAYRDRRDHWRTDGWACPWSDESESPALAGANCACSSST